MPEDIQQQILAELKAMRSQSGSRLPQGSGSVLPSFDFMNKLDAGSSALVQSFGKLATGTFTLNDAFGLTTGLLGNFGDIGRLVGKLSQEGAMMFVGMNNSLRQASDAGIYFKNNLGEYSKAVTGAQLTFEQFNSIVQSSGDRIAGIGAGADGSAKALLRLMKEVQDSGGEQNPNSLVYQLKATGIQAEVFNDVLIKSAANRKLIDLNEKSNFDSIAASTINVVEQMDNLSRLYGISAAQQRKNLQDQLDDVGIRARFNTLTVTQQNNLTESLAQLRGAGTSVQRLFTEMATSTTPGAIRSNEGRYIAAALAQVDNRIVPMMREIAVLTRSEKPEDRARAQEMQQRLVQITGESLQKVSGTVADLRYVNDPVQAELRKIYEQNAGLMGSEAQIKLMAAMRGITEEEARKEILRRAPKGKEEEDAAALSRTINQLDVLMKQLNAAGGLAFDKLNTGIGTTINSFEGLNKVLRNYSPENWVSMIEKIFKDAGVALEGVIKNADRANIPANVPKPGETLNVPRKDSGGDVFRDRLYTVGELGPEFFIPKVDGAIINNESIRSGFSNLNVIQADMKAALSTSKQTTQGLTKFQETLEKMLFSEQPKSPTDTGAPTAVFQLDQLAAAMTNIDRGLDKLNISMQAVKDAIEQGTDKNVRALKSAGNMIP